MRREIYTTIGIFVIAIILGALMWACAPPNTGIPDGQFAYLPTNTLICERKQAVKNFVDARLKGENGMSVIQMERRNIPGSTEYVPTCYINSTPQRILRLLGEPENYKDVIFLRQVRLRGSIVYYWTFQDSIEWR